VISLPFSLAIEASPSVKLYSEDVNLHIQAVHRKSDVANSDPQG